ncbi:MAG: reverse transcriptase domain-containing protein [Salinivirgaceae bacterium]
MLEQVHINTIRKYFPDIEYIFQLGNLINYTQQNLYKNSVNPIPRKAVTYYANPTLGGKRYQQFTIQKKNGEERTITAPVPTLNLLQACIKTMLAALYIPKPCVTGFVNGKSIVDNARVHVGQNYVYNIDIKDFFPSIHFRRVKTVLQLSPFNLKEKIAFMVANIACYQGVLPQGAPTSPILSNVICQRLDRRLTGLAKRFGCKYTRYADDITFSSMHNAYHSQSAFIKELHRIVKNENFTLNTRKTRLQHRNYRQEVTGLLVNEKVNVNKRYIRTIRAILHNWETKGLDKAADIFRDHYQKDRGNVKKKFSDIRNVIAGKLEYLAMVRGKNDALVQKYTQQFTRLMLHQNHKIPYRIDIKKVLETWETSGIEKAIALFYNEHTFYSGKSKTEHDLDVIHCYMS